MIFRALTLAVVSFLVVVYSMSVFAVEQAENFKTLRSVKKTEVIAEDGISFLVAKKTINPQKMESDQNASLIVGYPLELIGESHLFGAAIIKVSDATDENLGMLKTSSISGFVRSEIREAKNGGELELRGAYGYRLENSPLETVLTIPFTRRADQPDRIFLDFSSLGEKLNISSVLKKSEHWSADLFQMLTFKNARVVSVDFSIKTLVFDIASVYDVIEKEGDVVKSQKEVTITTRWFLRLSSVGTPNFISRPNVKGVGFFAVDEKTENAPITRFAISDLQRKPIKYYLKNVPKIWENAFVSAVLDWNAKLEGTLGYDLLSFEVLEKNDPRYQQIVTGDIRYNVIEWDLDNRAPYGGLGPNIAHPITGEVFAAQTLIQGPAVEELYTDWFQVKSPTSQSVQAQFEFSVELAPEAAFRIPAQDPRLFDPKAEGLHGSRKADFRMDFVPTPEGFNYESYMNGYFKEMVAHEVGHNLGLRHNFKGSLADDDSGKVGSVSWSVMEYAPRNYRHLNRVGDYDVMAMAYGYLGVMPTKLDMFCSDEDDGTDSLDKSPECSTVDATSDSYGFLLTRMNRGLDLLLNRGVNAAPTWTATQLQDYLPNFITLLSQYALSAEKTSSSWLNFDKAGRPTNSSEIYDFVRKDLNQLICDSALDAEAEKKSDLNDRDSAVSNLQSYRKNMFAAIKSVTGSERLLKADQLSCFQDH